MLVGTFSQGYEGRWVFGIVILVYLITYNETCGLTVVLSTLFAALYCTFAETCKRAITNLQISYIRAKNQFDFICLFLAVWMDTLSVLTACGALARTLSTCLDTMTGGLARILLLGRNSSVSEPWPDVIGVTVVFLMMGMFMLGLENTKVFTIVMMMGMLGVNVILVFVSWMYSNNEDWEKDFFQTDKIKNFFSSAALLTFSYPTELSNKQGWKRLIGFLIILIVCLSIMLVSVSISMITKQKGNTEYIAAPLFAILEENNYHKLVQAAACLLLLASSGAFLELFPEVCNIIVRLATSEWKVLLKQISYESPESGNPVLAIFIAGSFCAMLAFACPLQILTYVMAASHLCATLFRAFYLLYIPFRPMFIERSNDSSLLYSRLSTTAQGTSTCRRKSVWKFNLPIQNTMTKSISRTFKRKKKVEKEWLLLGEPSSSHRGKPKQNNDSEVFSDIEISMSDNDFSGQLENTESDTSTDIDAIVDEYRQKIKVTTAGLMEKAIRVPSISSWRVTVFAILVVAFGIGLAGWGVILKLSPIYVAGLIGIIFVSGIMSFIPKYTGIGTDIPPIICTITLTMGTLLLLFCLPLSWPAIVLWISAGLILVLRSDKWCCACLNQTDTQHIIPSISDNSATIRIPRSSKAFFVSGKIQGQNR